MTMMLMGNGGRASKAWTRGRVACPMHAYRESRGAVILSVAYVGTVDWSSHSPLPPSPFPSLPTAQGDQGHPRLPPEGPKVRTACWIHGGKREGWVEGRGLRVWHKCIYSLGLV